MKSEIGRDAKIPNLWRMSALLEMCPKDVKEQMMMKLDEIAVNNGNFKAKMVSYMPNKTEQTRGGQKEMYVPMEVDHYGGTPRGRFGRCGRGSKRVNVLQLRDDGDTSQELVEGKGKGKGERRRPGIQQRKKGKQRKARERGSGKCGGSMVYN